MASEEEKADAAAAEKYRGNILRAACAGGLPALRGILRADPGRVHEKSPWDGNTPLHEAALYGHVEAAELLLSKGASVNAKKNNGDTPLHEAAFQGRVEAAKLLLSKGASVNAKKNNGDTPLHRAAYEGKVQIVELLLSKGAAVDDKNNHGDTPLHHAAFDGKVQTVELLLSKGAAVDDKNNDGDTPLDVARRRAPPEVVQCLLNRPASEPTKGNNDVDSVAELRASAALALDDALEVRDAVPKAAKDPSSPAGSGAAAAKHQREVSKEEAAQELKKAMESGNAQALKEAIDKAKLHKVSQEEVMEAMDKYIVLQEAAHTVSPAQEAARELKKAMESGNPQALKDAINKAKLHKVSQEEVMEAMDKYIALRESADQAAVSPAQEAARELKKAMESGNAQVLKDAINKAKLHKVSQEEVMEAMDKYMALRESADRAAPSKTPSEAAPSKADQTVKLESGRGARLGMFSARFNAKNKDTEMKFRAVHKLLVENHYEILMVEAGAGESFGVKTLDYLRRLGEENGVMLAVCTSDYGEMTDSPYCTYYELKLAKEYNVDVLPLQVEDNWKPNPPCGEGHRDHSKSALSFIHAVFIPSIVRIDCRNKPVEEIAGEIAAALRRNA